MLTLIENGEVYAPEPLGRRSVLVAEGRIVRVGEVDRRALETLGAPYEVIDAHGCVVAPGLIDPHEHLLGGSGEDGFASATPEFFLEEIVSGGITTVVGALGVDTTMKTMPGLLAKVKALREEGLDAYLWTGGYNVPATSIMASVRDDILFIDEVIGAGEIAISDRRSTNPVAHELARLANDAFVAGMLSRKAGLTHLHVGDHPTRLAPLRDVLEHFAVEPGWFYATHVERSEELMSEAIEIAARGVAVDIDVVEEDLTRWLPYYLEHDGDPGQLTVSSDAGVNSPRTVLQQIRRCVQARHVPLELALSLVTKNPARILKLEEKGAVEAGKWGDLLVLEKGSLEIVHVLAKGAFMVRDGSLVAEPRFLADSNREIHAVGGKRRREEG